MSAPPGHSDRPLSEADAAALIAYFGAETIARLLEEARHANTLTTSGIALPSPTVITPRQAILAPSAAALLLSPSTSTRQFKPLPIDFCDWAERDFYIPDRIDPASLKPTEEIGPIFLMPWQKVLLRFMFDRFRPYDEFFQDYVISTLKKSGKTGIVAGIGRWIAETWGNYSEVLCCGADKQQAEDKLYGAIIRSIELDPTYDADLNTSFGIKLHPDSTPDKPVLVVDYEAPRWRIFHDYAQFIPNHGTVQAVPMRYKDVAGGKQTAALFTEMWTFDTEVARRMHDELTPIPTRPRSCRIHEGYAGFEGESGVWEELWEQAMDPALGARMVERSELEPYGGWPFPSTPGAFGDNPYDIHRGSPDPIPLYVNPTFRLVAYIDQGEVARRMPWQTPAYYEAQRNDTSYDRHHRNVASARVDDFVPKAWWDACNVINAPRYVHPSDPRTGLALPAGTIPEALRTIPPLIADESVVLSVDASVDDDTTALMVLSYATWWQYDDPLHPNAARRKRVVDDEEVMIRDFILWEPSKAHPMNYTTQLRPEIARFEDLLNVLEIVYDVYQLHDFMMQLRNDEGYWVKQFSQQTGRDQADNDLYLAIRDRHLWHNGDPRLEAHRAGSARRIPTTKGATTENRRHIIKKNSRAKVDLMVTISMAHFELKRING